MKYLRRRNEENNSVVALFEEKLGLRREVCNVLAVRGFNEVETANKFLHPFIGSFTPWQNYDGMQAAADKILATIESGGKIVVYGDYDCDGICATSMMYLAIKELNGDVNFYVPNRKRDGYGLNIDALEEIAERVLPDLIVTVDCGVTAVEEVDYAEETLGIEMIITDHHEPQSAIPQCIVVNPKVARKDNCFNELCGSGVVLKLIEALGGREMMMRYIDLAALATIADIVPLVDDNRIIVNYGIEIINARGRQAIKMLLDISFDDPLYEVTAGDIAYKIIPKINAVGRLSDPDKAVAMFVENDYFYAKSMVDHAMKTNEERRKITQTIYDDCLNKLRNYDLANNYGIVLSDDKWEAGVIGIVSSKIVEKFIRPTILLTKTGGMYKGSGRSIDGVNLYDILASLSDHLVSYGGHSMACGLAVAAENLQGFIGAFNDKLREVDREVFYPIEYYDIELPVQEVNNKLIDDMSILEPFGAGNPTVKYLCMTGGKGFNRVGSTKHVKKHIHEELEVIAFDKNSELPRYNNGLNKYMIFEGNTSVYKNKKYVTGTMMNMIASSESDAPPETYTAIKHLYQMKYSAESAFEMEIIDDDRISEMLNSSIYGTCMLCYNRDTYLKYCDKFEEELLRREISYIAEENPYNRLILDIDMSQNLEYYKDIIFLDKPARRGMVDYLRLNKNCRVMLYKGADMGYNKNVGIVKAHFMELDQMRGIFIRIKEILSNHQIERLGELYDIFASEAAVSDMNVEFYLAIYVFFELLILKVVNGKITVDNSVKTSLDNSMIYKGIKSAIASI